jgi:hypothetical protein
MHCERDDRKHVCPKGERADELMKLQEAGFKRPNIKVQVMQFQLAGDTFPIKVRDLPSPDIATISKPASDDEALAILHKFDMSFRKTTRTDLSA